MNHTYKIAQADLASKWSQDILGHGFTAVPNLLLMYRSEIGLTAAECLVVIAIESFRWSSDNPWPSLKALSKRSGYSPRNLSRLITSLEEKGAITRVKRSGTSNVYDMSNLIDWLTFAASQMPQPTDKRVRTSGAKNSIEVMTPLSPKEYAANNTTLRKQYKNIVDAEENQ